MNAYVFVQEATGDVLDNLRALVPDSGNQVRAVASLTGHHDAVVALSADTLQDLEAQVFGAIRGAGALKTETAVEVALPGPLPLPSPRWNEPFAVEAWVRARVQPGRALDVLNALGETGGVGAATLVAGEFDVLAIVGGSSFEEVSSALLEVSQIDGLEWTASAFTTNDVEMA